MARMRGIKVFALSMIPFLISVAGTNISETPEGRLYRYLMDDYVPVSPKRGRNQPIQVHMDFKLVFLKELNSVQQKLSTTAIVGLTWDYSYFQWNPNDYDGIRVLHIPAKLLWKPSIIFMNGVNGKFRTDEWEENMLIIWSQGTIKWNFMTVVDTACDLDISLFPMDSQHCKIIIHTEVPKLLNFTTSANSPNIKQYMHSTEWELIDASAEMPTGPREVRPIYGRVEYKLNFSRRPGNYIWTVIFPVIVLSGLGLLMFVIPHNSGERLSLGVTVMLSYTMFLTIVADHLPASAKSTPVLLILLVSLMVIQTATVALSVLTLNLEYNSYHWKMPGIIEIFIFKCIAKIVCLKVPGKNDVEEISDIEENRVIIRQKKFRLAARILDRFFFLANFTILVSLFSSGAIVLASPK